MVVYGQIQLRNCVIANDRYHICIDAYRQLGSIYICSSRFLAFTEVTEAVTEVTEAVTEVTEAVTEVTEAVYLTLRISNYTHDRKMGGHSCSMGARMQS